MPDTVRAACTANKKRINSRTVSTRALGTALNHQHAAHGPTMRRSSRSLLARGTACRDGRQKKTASNPRLRRRSSPTISLPAPPKRRLRDVPLPGCRTTRYRSGGSPAARSLAAGPPDRWPPDPRPLRLLSLMMGEAPFSRPAGPRQSADLPHYEFPANFLPAAATGLRRRLTTAYPYSGNCRVRLRFMYQPSAPSSTAAPAACLPMRRWRTKLTTPSA